MYGLSTLLRYLLVGLLFGCAVVHARSAPVSITADQAKFWQHKGKSVYTGNVVLTHAATTLRGNKLIIYRLEGDQIRAVLMGEPARLAHDPEQGETITGHADRIIFLSGANLVKLTGDAFIKRGQNTLHSHTIRHNLATGRTYAISGDDKGERVRITIHPDSVLSGEAGPEDAEQEQRADTNDTPAGKTQQQ